MTFGLAPLVTGGLDVGLRFTSSFAAEDAGQMYSGAVLALGISTAVSVAGAVCFWKLVADLTNRQEALVTG